MRTIVLVLVLALAGRAAAEPPGVSLVEVSRPVGEKSEAVAIGLTITGIVAPLGIMYYGATSNIDEGFVFGMGALLALPGPSMGQWYAHRWGGTGLGTRFVGLTSIVVGLSEIDDAKRCARGEQVADGCENVSRGLGRGMVGFGLATVAASWAYDLVASRRAVSHWNGERAVQLVPIAGRANGHTVGLALRALF